MDGIKVLMLRVEEDMVIDNKVEGLMELYDDRNVNIVYLYNC